MGEPGGAGGDAGPECGEDRPRPAGQLAGHRGHDAGRPLLMAEHERQPLHARRLEELQIGAPAGHAEETRHSRADQSRDEELGDGGHGLRILHQPVSFVHCG